MLSQWPVGILSDRIDRRLVIGGMGLASAVAALIMTIINPSPGTFLAQLLIGLWGAGALSFYGLCIAHAADRSEPEKIARMMSGLLFVWAFGSVLGPIFFGMVMSSPLGGRGLFIFEAVIGVLLFVLMIYRRGAKAPVADEMREHFEIAQPTSVVAAEIDPRTDIQPATEPDSDSPAANEGNLS